MTSSLKIKSVTSFILLIISINVESVCIDPVDDMFASIMDSGIDEINNTSCYRNDRKKDEKEYKHNDLRCKECLKTEPANDYILKKDLVKSNFIDQVLNNYFSIFVDFISFEDQIQSKEFFSACRLDTSENNALVCPITESKIIEVRKKISRLKDSFKKSKDSETEDDRVDLLKLSNGKRSCMKLLSGEKDSLLDSPYSHVLYGYYNKKLKEDQITLDQSEDEIESVYRRIPVMKYLNDSETQTRLNESISNGNFDMDEAARELSKNDLEPNIVSRCAAIKESLEATCTDDDLYDSDPFFNNYAGNNSEEEISSINYQICRNNPREFDPNDQRNIQKRLLSIENPKGIATIKKIRRSIQKDNTNIEKQFESRMQQAADEICEKANNEDEEVKAKLENDLKQVYKRAYYTPESEEVANIFIAPEKINKEVLSQKSEVKEIKKTSKAKSAKSTVSTAMNQGTSTVQSDNTRAISAPLQTSQVLQAPVRANNTAFTDTQTRIQNAKKVSSRAIKELNSLQNQNLDEIRNELNQIKSSSSNTFSSFTPQSTVIDGDSTPSSISTTIKEIRILTPNEVAEIESKKAQNTENIAAKNLSAGRSIASVENNIAGQPIISFNEDYFPKQNGKELDSVNLDLVFEKHQDDIFKILKSAKGHIIFIKDPYDSDQKLKVNLLKSLADNIEDIERDPKISLVKKKNLIRMKTYVYILGRETMKFKKDLNRKIDASRFKVTQNEYDNALERFKNVSYDKLLEIIRKNY